jgi:SAM-dependent methyltransferase
MTEIANVEQAASWDGPQGDVWVAREDALNAALVAHTEHLFAAADIRRTDHVLDVGCGTGETTRRSARQAPDGHALGVDLSSAMLDRARAHADADGVRNVTFEHGDAQVHAFEPEHFDRVLSRFGVMFFADPAAAFSNFAGATKAGGRLAIVVWQPVERNEWVAAPRVALACGRDVAPVVNDVPGAFGLADPDRLRQLLTDAGWSDVHLDGVSVPYTFGPDPESATASACEVGVIRGVLDGLSDDENARAVDALHALMVDHATPDGVVLDSEIWVVTAVR